MNKLGSSRIPLNERRTNLRGILDLLTGRYPRFLFGGSIGEVLPVFHFHEAEPKDLEAKLLYLAENGYQTVTSEVIANFVRTGKHPGPPCVALCFDDAWASLWTVAGPLLKKYGFTAIAYAIPGRITDVNIMRPTIEQGVKSPGEIDCSSNPFVTWTELKALHESGIIDVQSHSYSHSMMYCSEKVIDFVTPNYSARSPLSRPLTSANGNLVYLDHKELGAPIYIQRSRLSDARRYREDHGVKQRCLDYVERSGGEEFFRTSNWKARLFQVVESRKGIYESTDEQRNRIYEELDISKSMLNDRLRTNTVQHLCFPWGIAGDMAYQAAAEVGYKTAVSINLFGRYGVRAGDHPYKLMRLRNDFVYCLPGRAKRKWFFGALFKKTH